MLRVGITGGIGSGKSMVANIFSSFGIPVLQADKVAKELMENDVHLREQIQTTFGTESYQNGRLNRPFLANIIFNDESKLATLNKLVHPAVIAYGRDWVKKQTSLYVLKESALFFESGSNQDIDFMIGVSAPENIRVERIGKRDSFSEAEIKARMSQQMDEQDKMSRCDAIILNDGTKSILKQVLSLHQKLLSIASSGDKIIQ